MRRGIPPQLTFRHFSPWQSKTGRYDRLNRPILRRLPGLVGWALLTKFVATLARAWGVAVDYDHVLANVATPISNPNLGTRLDSPH